MNLVGKLEFNLEEEHCREAFRRANSANDMASALKAITEIFRDYKHSDLPEEVEKIKEEIRDKVWAILYDKNIDINNLWS